MLTLMRSWVRSVVLLSLPLMATLPSWRMLGCLPAMQVAHHGHSEHEGSNDDESAATQAHCCHLAPCEAPWSAARAAADAPLAPRSATVMQPTPRPDTPIVPRPRWQPPATAPPRSSPVPN